jgi:hypothetical protein
LRALSVENNRYTKSRISPNDVDGCNLYGHCLECPLPLCQFDVTLRSQLSKILSARLLRLYEGTDVTIIELAETFNLSRYTIIAKMRSAREEKVKQDDRHGGGLGIKWEEFDGVRLGLENMEVV